ncbi:MAG: hypothetical protein R3C11_18915 [Planctomycetaceae bacterium]
MLYRFSLLKLAFMQICCLALTVVVLLSATTLQAKLNDDPQIKASIGKALDYLAREQRRQGYWEANGGQYRVAMTALSGMALAAEGSTPSRGRFAPQIKLLLNISSIPPVLMD